MMRRTDEYPQAPDAPANDDPVVTRDDAPVATERQVVEERPAAAEDRRVVVETAPSPEFGGRFVFRLLLTLAGAAAMIVGAFGAWTPTHAGTELSDRALVQTTFTTSTFLISVGAIGIALGLVAEIGLAFRSGWVTRFAGTLGIVTVALYAIELSRIPGPFPADGIGLGAWAFLAGSVATLIGGFLTTRSPEVVATNA